MREVDDAEALDLWGVLAELSGPARLRALVEAAGTCTTDAVEALPLGRAQVAVLDLVTAIAGPTLECTVACPGCDAVVEFALDADGLRARAEEAGPVVPVDHDGWHVEWSPLTLGDFLAAAGQPAEEASVALLTATVDAVKTPDGSAAEPGDLPPAVVAAVAAAQLDADPLLEVLVDLACAACDAPVTALVDPVTHASAAVEARARRLLDEIDDLARAYSWSEEQVLALPRWRRAAYVDRVRSGTT